MKKALLMGVSAMALAYAASANASGVIGQEQDFHAANNQGQYQGVKTMADGGDAYAKADGGDAGGSAPSYSSKYGSHSSGSGGDGGYAKAYAEGGDAYAKAKQDQGQEQYVSGSQKQMVYLPDINVDVDVASPGNGGGGAAGPGLGDGGDGGNNIEGDDNEVQSPEMEDSDESAQAVFRSRAAADIDGIAILGDNVNLDSFNVTMRNDTNMEAANAVGPITLDGGNANGGELTGGGIDLTLENEAETEGDAGDADNNTGTTTGGNGGYGGDGKAYSSNYLKQKAYSDTESEGGDAKAYSNAYSKSKAKSDADAYAKSYADTYAKAKNKVEADADADIEPGSGGYSSMYRKHDDKRAGDNTAKANADAGGSAENWVKNKADSDAEALAPAESWSVAEAPAKAKGGAGGDVMSKTGNSADQSAHSMAAGGNGGDGGDASVHQEARGGDNAQMASADQTVNAATGATSGANGGSIAVTFGTGNIGAISLGTISGIATVAQNTGLSANQFTSFSINAHTTF